MAIKIGNLNIDSFKVGSGDCTIYLGDTLLYPLTPPSFEGKWLATYIGGTTSSAECDSSSAITENEITKTDLESVIIGDCVTSIGIRALRQNTTLTSVTIGNGVTSIGSNSFYQDSNLASVVIGNGVTSIDYGAFQNCTSLTSITIPNSVTSIGSSAFRSCTSLTSIVVNTTTPPTLNSAAFLSTNNCPIYVPSESVETYKAASGWSNYASRIQAIP